MPDDGMGATASDSVPGTKSSSGVVARETFPADFRWVRRGVQKVAHDLARQGITREDLGTLEIVLAEALNNIVEHAYPEDTSGDITLTVRLRSTSVMVEIQDNGRPMPQGRAPIGNHPMTEFDNQDAMPEGGYGWFMIRELVRDLVYDRHDGNNFLLFRLPITLKPSPQSPPG